MNRSRAFTFLRADFSAENWLFKRLYDALFAILVYQIKKFAWVRPGSPAKAVAGEYGVSKEALSGSGRREDWVAGRRLLVYIARSWSEMTTGEIGKRLGRDPSMISRLYRDYEGQRERQREKRLSRLLSRRVQTHA